MRLGRAPWQVEMSPTRNYLHMALVLHLFPMQSVQIVAGVLAAVKNLPPGQSRLQYAIKTTLLERGRWNRDL